MAISKKSAGVAIVAAWAIAGLAVPAIASHAWSNYHWQRSGTEVTVPVYDSTNGEWPARVSIAVADWNRSAVIQSPLSRGNSDPSCPIVSGQINVCNDDYGSTGWLGI
ncbi:MAG TPA: hypothetical protein VFX62_07380, partial [Erythrobacter sp.]|nr:hypothetical protein [Erythrobacter sp.]